MTALLSARFTTVAEQGIGLLETALIANPPSGADLSAITGFFARYRASLIAGLAASVQYAYDSRSHGRLHNAKRCAVCRELVGSNPRACSRCEAHARDVAEPLTADERERLRMDWVAAETTTEATREARLAPLRGRLVRVALVGCGSKKSEAPQPAKDLYQGSLFKAARRYAESCVDSWVILSAAYGMLVPEEVREPYERSLGSMRDAEKDHWAYRVSLQIRDHYEGLTVEYVGLAGQEYLQRLSLNGPLSEPMRGLGIGERLQWLSAASTRCEHGPLELPAPESQEAEHAADRAEQNNQENSQPPVTEVEERTTPSGSVEQDKLNYYLRVNGIWGRNRKEKSELLPLVKGVNPQKPKELSDLLPLMRAKMSELRIKMGSRLELQEHPVTLVRYPDSKYVLETSLMGQHRVLLRETLGS